jgi:hypothetical protein
MSLVKRSPQTNFRGKEANGVVRFITKKGAPVNFDSSNRPVGQGEGTPDVNRASKGVASDARANFNAGKNITRNSVYDHNNS